MTDWDQFKKRLEHILQKQLRLKPSDCTVLVVEPPVHNRDFRLKMVECLLEQMNFQGVSFQKSAMLSTLYYAKENALVLDCGSQMSYASPVIDGMTNAKSVIRSTMGGDFLVERLREKILARPENVKEINRLIAKDPMASKNPVVQAKKTKAIIEELSHSYGKIPEDSYNPV